MLSVENTGLNTMLRTIKSYVKTANIKLASSRTYSAWRTSRHSASADVEQLREHCLDIVLLARQMPIPREIVTLINSHEIQKSSKKITV
jgi:hypothetical protein